MKKTIFALSLITILLIAPASAEVRVKDANGNELGILLDYGDTMEYSPLVVTVKIFIPKLNKSIVISKMDGEVICGHFYWSDNLASNPDYLADCGTIYRLEGGIYICGVCPSMSDPITATVYYEQEPYFSEYDGLHCGSVYSLRGSNRVAFRTEEVTVEEIPFLLPVALPLSYEYVPGGNEDTSDRAALEDELNMLRLDIMALEEHLSTHQHSYLTGKGRGHNNTTADTTEPIDGLDQSLVEPKSSKGKIRKKRK